MVRDYGIPGAAAAGYGECSTRYSQGQAAMWYDATAMVSSVESPSDSVVVGKNGYAPAPVVETKHSGWLYTWSLGIPKSAKNPDAAWKFLSWVTSKGYIKLVGHKLGWQRVPPGSRLSTYQIPQYAKIAKAYAQPTLDALRSADQNHATVQPVPYTGIQFVGIPEFQDLGTRVGQQISAAIAGQVSVDEALKQSQLYAESVGQSYQGGQR
jgi:sorbitol/mannitol transport system substrate-binding protein